MPRDRDTSTRARITCESPPTKSCAEYQRGQTPVVFQREGSRHNTCAWYCLIVSVAPIAASDDTVPRNRGNAMKKWLPSYRREHDITGADPMGSSEENTVAMRNSRKHALARAYDPHLATRSDDLSNDLQHRFASHCRYSRAVSGLAR